MQRLNGVGGRAALAIGMAAGCLACASPAVAAGWVTSCTASAADVAGSPVVVANPQQTPCQFDNQSTAAQSVALPWIMRGWYWATVYGPQSFTYSSAAGDTSSASSNVGRFEMTYVGLQVSATSLWSSAQAAIGPCPATAQTSGGAGSSSLRINGVAYDGNSQQTVDVPGVATIYVAPSRVDAGTITRSALDIQLASGQHVVVARSVAGEDCS